MRSRLGHGFGFVRARARGLRVVIPQSFTLRESTLLIDLHCDSVSFFDELRCRRIVSPRSRSWVRLVKLSFLASNYGLRALFFCEMLWVVGSWIRPFGFDKDGHPLSVIKFSTTEYLFKPSDTVGPWPWDFTLNCDLSILGDEFPFFREGKLFKSLRRLNFLFLVSPRPRNLLIKAFPLLLFAEAATSSIGAQIHIILRWTRAFFSLKLAIRTGKRVLFTRELRLYIIAALIIMNLAGLGASV